jgi:carboxyl-terminal processing protease
MQNGALAMQWRRPGKVTRAFAATKPPLRRRRRAFAAILFACSLWCLGVPPMANAEDLSLAHSGVRWDKKDIDRAKLYDAIIETIEKKFFDEALLNQLDWRVRANATRSSALSAATAEEAVQRIRTLLSELKTSHTALITPDEYQYYFLLDVVGAGEGSDLLARQFWGTGPYYPGTGAFTREVEGRHFIDGVLENSPADRAGLKYGDEVLSVDGMPYSPIAAFRGKIGKIVELKIRRSANAEPQGLSVQVIPIRPTRAFSDATEASARVIERNGSRIGYVHIWSLHEPSGFRNALAKLGNVAPKIDSLVVDVRGRVGGRTDVAEQNLELLDVRRPYWGKWRTLGRSERPANASKNQPLNVPSALLIDHDTRSAGEMMAYGYQRGAFGLLVGTPTAGAVSAGATFVMPGDLLLYVAVAGIDFDGRRLEGAGVIPDLWVERPLPYAAGFDPVLDTAVDLLTKDAAK